jgi:two-component system CAI-1 autoinducer sensor kinase/phosphatase CqsS
MGRLNKIYQYAEPNLALVVIMGGLGFPTYYLIWTYWFPQGYENVWLRVACCIIVGVLGLREYIPNRFRKYLPHYYLFAISACLPFFFFFMMLMNNWSDVWVMSFMSSIFLHILLVHDSRVMCIQAIVTTFLAYVAAYYASGGQVEIVANASALPVFAFTYIFGNLFYFRNQTEHEAKVSIAKSFGAGIAHEMRNPLSALLSSFEVIRSIVPSGSSTFRNSYHLNNQEIQILNEIIDDSMKTIWTGNETIDLLLTSIDQNRVSTSTFCKHSASQVINNAVESFSYKNASERTLVHINIQEDFDYFGSDTLLKYVIYNLLKNAFRHRGTTKFSIQISTVKSPDGYTLKFKDTGVGIEQELIKHIFEDFYTTGKAGTFGLGLSFCKKVMNSFGGSIRCRSTPHEWTEFELTFPDYSSAKVNGIKLDLIKAKSVLFIGTEETLFKQLTHQSLRYDFELSTMTLEQASNLEEHQFEYHLIIIDGSLDRDGWPLMSRVESKLGFTEARIAFLYDPMQKRNLYFQRYVDIKLVDREEYLQNFDNALDALLFDDFTRPEVVQPYNDLSMKRTVLIVDDNHSLRSITSIMLEKQGLNVLQAENGQVALSTLEEEDVDLVLMDIEMPVLDGLSATKQIRESNAHYASVPIVGYTGDKSPETVIKIEKYGMNDYIVKPTPKDELIDKVANWI